jgi:hypothetical protein
MTTPLPHHHRRGALLREIDTARGWRTVPGLWEAFHDEDDLLRAAQQLWFTAVGSAIEDALEIGEGNLVEDVRDAYAAVARRHPGVRRMLDENQKHPAIAASVRREHALVARAAGVEHSDEVIEAARQTVHVPAPRRSLLARVFQSA